MTMPASFELRMAAFADLARTARPLGVDTGIPVLPEAAPARPRRRHRPATAVEISRPVPGEAAHDPASVAGRGRYLDLPQTRAICAAAATLGQVHGQSFNLSFEFHHQADDHSVSARSITNFHRRARQRTRRRGQAMFPFVYVHETGQNGALMTRFVCCVDFALDGDFLSWTKTGFASSRAGRTTTVAATAYCEGERRSERVAFHERCLHELLGGVDPTLEVRDASGRLTPLIELLGVRPDDRRVLGVVTCPQRFGVADALGPTMRAVAGDELPLRDALDGTCGLFGRGWELDEYVHRRAELEALAEERCRIDVLFPGSSNALIQARRAMALAGLEAQRAHFRGQRPASLGPANGRAARGAV